MVSLINQRLYQNMRLILSDIYEFIGRLTRVPMVQLHDLCVDISVRRKASSDKALTKLRTWGERKTLLRDYSGTLRATRFFRCDAITSLYTLVTTVYLWHAVYKVCIQCSLICRSESGILESSTYNLVHVMLIPESFYHEYRGCTSGCSNSWDRRVAEYGSPSTIDASNNTDVHHSTHSQVWKHSFHRPANNHTISYSTNRKSWSISLV